jgi:hypothetical protein
MKKTVALILAFMYLGITSGLAVNIHYCMGKIADVQLDAYKETSCKCGNKKQMPCCNHQYEVLKVNDAHQQVTGDISIKTPEIILHTFDNLIALLSLPQTQQEVNIAYAPPLLSPPDIYIENCTFRI